MSSVRPLNTVIIGAAGRMGRALIRAAAEIPNELRVCGAVASTTSDALGKDAGDLAGIGRLDVRVTDDLAAALARAEIVIDFSQPHTTRSNLMVCRAARKPLLIGTTGFPAELTSVFDEAAKEIPLLIAPNTSIGVTLLLELTRMAAKALPVDFDVEIVEAHHRMKKDAPSGTALALGKAAAAGRSDAGRAGSAAATTSTHAPAAISTDRSGARRQGDVGYAVIRGGDIVGDHTVLFAGTGEQITLGHRATDRAIFARGAVRAALWLAAQPAGRYIMRDFLGLKTST
ncbi:MAG TPA: 4-hydroxy-tetrahydrodipicolinate reductase [Steroidobacteraceae bacterium]|nr:4-hydroxy-tetrahydrodipicolinate reductase [Steroidobacteraceae bacterium]